jgi:hypothetical protein
MEVDGNVDAVSGDANVIELYCGAKVATFEGYISYRNGSVSIEDIVSGLGRKVGTLVTVGSDDLAGVSRGTETSGVLAGSGREGEKSIVAGYDLSSRGTYSRGIPASLLAIVKNKSNTAKIEDHS